jgi:hypothetical protein
VPERVRLLSVRRAFFPRVELGSRGKPACFTTKLTAHSGDPREDPNFDLTSRLSPFSIAKCPQKESNLQSDGVERAKKRGGKGGRTTEVVRPTAVLASVFGATFEFNKRAKKRGGKGGRTTEVVRPTAVLASVFGAAFALIICLLCQLSYASVLGCCAPLSHPAE